jgi:alpha-L-arabinofuranosidase
MKRLKVDLVDEHFYRPYNWFLSQGTRYDSYDRNGPIVFAGEYACHASGRKWNHYYAAILEAAFMTNLERNADIVHMATYAPLFAHVEGWQWRPDLIWFDNLNSFRTVSWHVQQLYGQYKGENVLALTMDGAPIAGKQDQNGLFASAVCEGDLIYIKVINTSEQAQQLTLKFNGLKNRESIKAVKRIDLQSDKLYEDNIEDPTNIIPVEKPFSGQGKEVETTVAPQSFSILVLTVE